MQLLILLINTAILVLTEIGDFVLFYLSLVLKIGKGLVKLIFRLIFDTLRLLGKSIRKSLSYSKTVEVNVVNRIKLVNFRLLLFSKRFKRKFRPNKKKEKPNKKKESKQTVITFFPAPKHYTLKLKYFVVGFLFCSIFILIPFSLYTFLMSLPNPKMLTERAFPQTTKIFDRNGTLLYQIYANENRTLVPLNSIPKNLINATIAIEDKDFYTNPGFDINGILRAALADAEGKPIQGGSTITQQLIKSTLLTPEVSITRKIKEIVLAFWAERIYSKNQILEM